METDESIFVLTADSRDGRLVIQQRKKRGAKAGEEVCSLSLANPDELEAFFEGLRRVLSSPGLALAPHQASERPISSRQPARRSALPATGDPQREEVIARARGRNAKAFERWSRQEEEEEVRRRYQAGESVKAIARAHNRSPKAIQMRLERLGAMPRAGR